MGEGAGGGGKGTSKSVLAARGGEVVGREVGGKVVGGEDLGALLSGCQKSDSDTGAKGVCVGEEEESSPVHVRVVGDAVGRGLRSKSVSENVEAEDGAYEGRERSSFSGAVGRTGDADLRDLIKGGGVGGTVPSGVGISVSWNLHLSVIETRSMFHHGFGHDHGTGTGNTRDGGSPENMEILLGYTV